MTAQEKEETRHKKKGSLGNSPCIGKGQDSLFSPSLVLECEGIRKDKLEHRHNTGTQVFHDQHNHTE